MDQILLTLHTPVLNWVDCTFILDRVVDLHSVLFDLGTLEQQSNHSLSHV